MTVGFIGLGAMGLPMAENVIKAGYPLVTMYHKRREPADALASRGAAVVANAAEVARTSEVVITIVPADAELRETVFGTNALLSAWAPGKILIDMTTCTAKTLLEVEKALTPAGGHVLDAPVSGGTTAAAAGTLTVMAGGDAALLEQCRPLLQSMASRIFHVGGAGQGKVVKTVNQMMAAIHLLAMGEAMALGASCGANPETLYEVIKESSGYSRMMDLRLRDFLLAGSFQPGFKLDLMKKDVQLALDSARAQGVPLLVTGLAAQLFSAASAAGFGDDDFSRAAQYLVEMAHVDLPSACASTRAAS